MAEHSSGQKTELPTPARRREARREGQIAFSSDLSHGLMLLIGAAVVWFAGHWSGRRLIQTLRQQLSQLSRTSWGASETIELAKVTLGDFFATAGFIAAGVFLVTAATGLLQSGFHLTGKPLKPDWGRVSFTKGWSRLFSVKSGVRGLMTLGKVAMVSALVWWLFDLNLEEISRSGDRSLLHAVVIGWATVMKMALAVGGTFAFLGILDYGFQRWKHEQDLRMTRQEMKDEQKQEEGDPHLRARIRKLQREVAQRQMIQDVPSATVVLTNPTHLAVALRYDRSGSGAPLIVAKGADHLAKRIVSIARDHGIPVVENKPLARVIFQSVDVGQQIPASLYRAVAEILARIYALKSSA